MSFIVFWALSGAPGSTTADACQMSIDDLNRRFLLEANTPTMRVTDSNNQRELVRLAVERVAAQGYDRASLIAEVYRFDRLFLAHVHNRPLLGTFPPADGPSFYVIFNDMKTIECVR
jgi:hypothetical protein